MIDANLIQLALLGNQSACRQLYERHVQRVQLYFVRSGFTAADAEDLSQEAFIRFFRSLKSFDPQRGQLRTWLGAIARNVARRRWAARTAESQYDPQLAENMFASIDNPGDESAFREYRQAVNKCLGLLPEDLAGMVRLRYVQGLSTRGVAAETGMPEATVRLRLAEALALLQRCLRSKGILQADS